MHISCSFFQPVFPVISQRNKEWQWQIQRYKFWLISERLETPKFPFTNRLKRSYRVFGLSFETFKLCVWNVYTKRLKRLQRLKRLIDLAPSNVSSRQPWNLRFLHNFSNVTRRLSFLKIKISNLDCCKYFQLNLQSVNKHV